MIGDEQRLHEYLKKHTKLVAIPNKYFFELTGRRVAEIHTSRKAMVVSTEWSRDALRQRSSERGEKCNKFRAALFDAINKRHGYIPLNEQLAAELSQVAERRVTPRQVSAWLGDGCIPRNKVIREALHALYGIDHALMAG